MEVARCLMWCAYQEKTCRNSLDRHKSWSILGQNPNENNNNKSFTHIIVWSLWKYVGLMRFFSSNLHGLQAFNFNLHCDFIRAHLSLIRVRCDRWRNVSLPNAMTVMFIFSSSLNYSNSTSRFKILTVCRPFVPLKRYLHCFTYYIKYN